MRSTSSGTIVIGGNGFACTTQYCCQPVRCMNARPSGYSSGLFVSTTTPTPFERTGSPIATPRHVVAALVDPAADRRVDAEVAHLEQRLALAELGDGNFRRVEARLGHHADRPLGEHHLPVHARGSHGSRSYRHARSLTPVLPLDVADLTPEWFSTALGLDVDARRRARPAAPAPPVAARVALTGRRRPASRRPCS